MNNIVQLEDVMTIENGAESQADYYSSVQRLINAGQWSMQGSFGRTMMDAIRAGYCLLGPQGCRDYRGKYIPAFHEVEAGTAGSFDYVADECGTEWAEMMSEVV